MSEEMSTDSITDEEVYEIAVVAARKMVRIHAKRAGIRASESLVAGVADSMTEAALRYIEQEG